MTINWSLNELIKHRIIDWDIVTLYERHHQYRFFLPQSKDNTIKVWLSNPNGKGTDMNTLTIVLLILFTVVQLLEEPIL